LFYEASRGGLRCRCRFFLSGLKKKNVQKPYRKYTNKGVTNFREKSNSNEPDRNIHILLLLEHDLYARRKRHMNTQNKSLRLQFCDGRSRGVTSHGMDFSSNNIRGPSSNPASRCNPDACSLLLTLGWLYLHPSMPAAPHLCLLPLHMHTILPSGGFMRPRPKDNLLL